MEYEAHKNKLRALKEDLSLQDPNNFILCAALCTNTGQFEMYINMCRLVFYIPPTSQNFSFITEYTGTHFPTATLEINYPV